MFVTVLDYSISVGYDVENGHGESNRSGIMVREMATAVVSTETGVRPRLVSIKPTQATEHGGQWDKARLSWPAVCRPYISSQSSCSVGGWRDVKR